MENQQKIEEWMLKQWQGLDLEVKIKKSRLRIKEWYEHFEGDVYISFSGGKDSTVMYYIIKEMYPNIEVVFCDTGLEYPENREFAKKVGAKFIKPKRTFKEVIDKYGYPFPTKQESKKIYEYKKTKSESWKKRLINGKDGKFAISKKWLPLIHASFDVSHKCCYHLKKSPLGIYERETGKKPYIGTMASEGFGRKYSYMKYGGCNAFNMSRPKSRPLGFWTEQDILKYLKETGKPYSKIYGDIVEKDGKFETTGVERTGCIFCMFGVHQEKEPNRFQKLKESHPKLYDYCINELNLKEVLDYYFIPY